MKKKEHSLICKNCGYEMGEHNSITLICPIPENIKTDSDGNYMMFKRGLKLKEGQTFEKSIKRTRYEMIEQ